MHNALIVVDAWKATPEHDLVQFPALATENKLYGQYLNHLLSSIRSTTTIFHNPSRPWLDIMDEIDTSQDKIVHTMNEVSVTDFDNYFFCGFHLGRCVRQKMHEFNELGVSKSKMGVVLNMTSLYPDDSFITMHFDKRYNAYNTYMYSHKMGFECTNIM
tara:strand:- start:190 stop:666 length:477 start_codon:yes stop_codon:yes gene_type:complete